MRARARQDDFDEEFELELNDDGDDHLARMLAGGQVEGDDETLARHRYFQALFDLQAELVKLQDWVVHQGLKVIVIFEGRDAAGKGGVIKRITQRLNPRVCRVVALSAPNERERTQWYFQRYAPHLPAAGEIVLFDRSWYNRAGVERVMGFCTEEDVAEFFRSVPEFERMLVRSGIVLVKYWFSITDDEQHFRFEMRANDPIKQWKLQPDGPGVTAALGGLYTCQRRHVQHTHIPEAPWWVVEAVDKKRARLNCIHHLLSQFQYAEVPHAPIKFPDRVHHDDYVRHPLPSDIYVPEVY